VQEQTYRRRRRGPLVRPFAASAAVECRGYSLGLQRVLVDFGAEESFPQAAARVREHYGLEISSSALRRYTEAHAAAMQVAQAEERAATHLAPGGQPQMIGEIDGGMVPIVTTRAAPDRRKTRQVAWQEARLALAHAQGSVSPQFAATLGDVAQAGAGLRHCVARAGGGAASALHCVGDGATWISAQVVQHFGSQGSYLVDFYHVSEYLAAAAVAIAGAQATAWRQAQQEHLKANRTLRVLTALKAHLEPEAVADEVAPVRCCYRYLLKRLDHLNYQDALARGLPIGSGEIESAHRYVVQKRLKLAGAWWTAEQAANMLALRVTRANGDWEAYWEGLRQAAA
jgi:hypothetical protein